MTAAGSVPRFLYGTAWKEDRTEALVRLALDAGFRGIDTANQRRHYFEAAVGSAVAAWCAERQAAREDLFLQTKFTSVGGQDHRLPYDAGADPATQVQQSFASSLEHLRTTYVDSYVLHGPRRAAASPTTIGRPGGRWRHCTRAARRGCSASATSRSSSSRRFATAARSSPSFVQNRCFAVNGWDHDVRALLRRDTGSSTRASRC